MRPQTPPYITFCCLLTAVLVLLAGCSKDEGFDETKTAEITLQTDVWRIMDATRATTFDNQAALQTKGTFTCAVYNAETTTPYINATSVNWDGTASKWEFSDGKHYWPASGSLDFFAYMPAAAPSYITGPTYTTARAPQFTCTSLPMTPDGQSATEEFIYALTTGQSKAGQGNSGVTMTFQHPFARIKLQLSESQEDIHINSITLKSIKNNGDYVHGTGWTPSGDATNFVFTLNNDYEANHDFGTYLMMPQNWAGEIEINADWNVWGVSKNHTVSATVPTTWQSGYSYTYTITITETDLKVDIAKFTEQW